LTAAALERAKPGMHGAGGGLYLAVGASGSRSWIFRYQRNGRSRELGLGSASAVGLAAARDKAIDARRLLADGIDPIERRDSERAAAKAEAAKAITFGDYAKTFIAGRSAGWRNAKHADQWRMTLLGIGPKGDPAKHDYCRVIRNLPIGDVDATVVLKVLTPIWQTRPETASRIRSRIENLLDAAKVEGLREGENPARWKGGLQHVLAPRSKVRKVRHHPALPHVQMPTFMTELRRSEGIAARCLEYQILTAVRPGNAVRARWEQVDRKAKTWTIPADAMKGGEAHAVPLSDAALAVLEQMEKVRRGPFIFPSTMGRGAGARLTENHLSDAAQAKVIERLGAKGTPWIDPVSGDQAVPHGFRSSFRDWGAETNAAPEHVLEACLAHKVSDEIIAAYRRSKFDDRRRQVMTAWANYLGTGSVDNVVMLTR
jgi:integrase